eukprot:scaffold12134_cov112-Skeletonema_dohrnii-CCMP3373.AAC.4
MQMVISSSPSGSHSPILSKLQGDDHFAYASNVRLLVNQLLHHRPTLATILEKSTSIELEDFWILDWVPTYLP